MVRWDVLGVGAVAVDDMVFVDRYPASGTKVAVEATQRHGGGLTGTALVAAARLGARTAYCGIVGFDELSQFAVREFEKERVDCSPIARREGALPVHSMVIVVRPTGQRTVLCSHAAVVPAAANQISDQLVSQCRVLLVDNSVGDGGRRAVALARELGVPVVADFEPDAGPTAPDLMALVDHLIVGSEFAHKATGESDPRRMVRVLASPGRACCVVTAGELGCWYSERGGGVRHVPAFSVDVVDTTGCGDVFHGAYAASIARGERIARAIEVASAAAALKATQAGGRAGVPDMNAVEGFLAQGGHAQRGGTDRPAVDRTGHSGIMPQRRWAAHASAAHGGISPVPPQVTHTMMLVDVLAQIEEPGCLEAVHSGWEESVATMPPEPPSFLRPVEFRASRSFARLPAQSDEVLEAAAAGISDEPALLHLVWHAYRTLSGPQDEGDFRDWPVLRKTLGDLAGAFYMLVGLAAVPQIRALHREMGIPEDVTRDTCHVLVCLSWNYEREHPGRLGIMLKELFWVRNHLKGRLFRIGRLEFMIGPFRGCLETYRHRTNGRVIALAVDGTRFTRTGFLPYRGESPATGEWVASLRKADDRVVGYAISPWGIALQQEVCLSLADWQLELWPGQPALEFHIPEGGGMTPARCLDSMRRGLAFFGEHFPETPVSGFHSHSWIFGSMLEEYLPSAANLVRLLKEVYLFPVLTTPREGLYYIFGSDDIDLSTAPRDTNLRRSTIDYLDGGGWWHCGGMFVMGTDLSRFGSQIYRSQWAETLGAAS